MDTATVLPVVWFGILPLPDLVSPDKALAELIKPWHGWELDSLVS